MKKVYIVDGNEQDEAKVTGAVGTEYDIASVSYYDIMSIALSTIITLANTIDSLDAYAGGHSLRVAVIARDIARNIGWDDKDCQNVYFVALLHDLGMITVPDSIVRKPERLSMDEMDVVKCHTVNGAKILRDISILDHLSEGVMYHHERWDGSGYPEKLAGDDIPPFARVIAVADAYDAMSSDRVYRNRLSQDKIISEFTRCRGTQFDPDITDVFIFMLKGGYTVDADIEQTREASERAVRDGGLAYAFLPDERKMSGNDSEMDMLTGLFSRSYLNTRVGNRISEDRSGALMMIELTGYEGLRTEYGRKECDYLVKTFSQRLKTFFREEDIICRIAEDMFAVYVSGDSGKGVAQSKAERIASVLTAYDEFGKYRSCISVATGIAMCMEDGVTFEELYGAAMSALEKKKEN